MEMYEKLIEMLEKELKQFVNKSEISSSHLEMIEMITHSIKSAETILAMRGESRDYQRDYTGTSTRRGRRRGYSSDYSGAGASEDMIRQLEDMRASAPESMKRRIDSMIDDMRR